jgi:glucan phosphorylase
LRELDLFCTGDLSSARTLLALLTLSCLQSCLAPPQVTAVAYDNPIPGFKTRNCINLRLWAAKPSREFDLEAFNTGDYVQVRTMSVAWSCNMSVQSL